jgi:CheY-like chemotaxis protein
VLNLALNARDAMARGGTLAIETRNTLVDEDFAVRHPDMEPGPHVTISVSDTGTGIPRDIVDMIFEPFFTTRSKAESTGLGLSMVYGIVKQAGGHVSVYTEPGIGTTFNIYLKAAEHRVVAAEEWVEVPLRSGRGERVLVAEDDPAVLEAAERMLSRNGYEVLKASSGEKALEVVKERREHVDVLLTDVVMPKMSGRELASHMRSVRPETKIIFMSGYTGDIIDRHGVLGSDENYIQKPFTADELIRKIGDVL